MSSLVEGCTGLGIKLLAVTVPLDMDFKTFMGVFYSCVPYVMVGVYIVGILLGRRFSLLLALIVGLIGSGANEWIFKTFEKSPRPNESCITGNGFPSGHSVNSIATFTWAALEILIYKNFSWLKKGIYIFLLLLVFGPVGPARYAVRDHSWKEIGAGMALGFGWGLLYFLLLWVFLHRYLEEYLFRSKLFKFLGVTNDYDPTFRWSKWKGKKFEAKNSTEKKTYTNRWENLKPLTLIILHSVLPIFNLALGIIGIVLGQLKEDDSPNCELSAPALVVSAGCLTILVALLQCVLIGLLWQRLYREKFLYDVFQVILFLTGWLFFEALAFNYSGLVASSNTGGCPDGTHDKAEIYTILWFVVQLCLWIYIIIGFLALRLRNLYADKEIPQEVNQNKPGKQSQEMKEGTNKV